MATENSKKRDSNYRNNSESVLTYEGLYEVLRNEKYKPELQKMEDDFFSAVVDYLEEKKAILKGQESKDSIFVSHSIQGAKKQIENVQKIFREIYEKREGKIVQFALLCSKRNGDNKGADSTLLPIEKQLFEELVNVLNKFRKGVLLNVLDGKIPELKRGDIGTIENNEEIKNYLVRFLQAVPQFVAEDANTYGPFEKEDMAHLPSKVSALLVKSGRAEEI